MRNIRDGRGLASLASMLVRGELKGPQKAWPQLNRCSPLASHHRCSPVWPMPGLLLATTHQQAGQDERLQASVQHAVQIAYFHLRAVVLKNEVRLQHLKSNLRSI